MRFKNGRKLFIWLLIIFWCVVDYSQVAQAFVCKRTQPPWQSISDANLAWQPVARQNMVVTALNRIPAAWYRDALRPNAINREISILQRIQSQGKKILLLLVQEEDAYANPVRKYAGETFEKMCGWRGGNLPLSGIDVGKLQTQLRSELAALVQAHVKVDAFEIGNELDWVCFNTDLPFDVRAGNITDDKLLPFARAYARFLNAAVQTIKERDLYPNATIVTFGIANTMERIPAHAIAHPAHLLKMLKNLDGRNYLNLVDRVGVHLYPDPKHPETIVPALKRFISEGQITKPLWITEWGYPNKSFRTGGSTARLRAFTDFYNAVIGGNVPVENMFLFSIASPNWTLIDPGGHVLPEAAYFNNVQDCS